jgi:hypothetical protein
MREEGEMSQKLVVSRTDATWCGPWEIGQNDDDWKKMATSCELYESCGVVSLDPMRRN